MAIWFHAKELKQMIHLVYINEKINLHQFYKLISCLSFMYNPFFPKWCFLFGGEVTLMLTGNMVVHVFFLFVFK